MPKQTAKRKHNQQQKSASAWQILLSSPSTHDRASNLSSGPDEIGDPGRIESQHILKAAWNFEKHVTNDKQLSEFRAQINKDKAALEKIITGNLTAAQRVDQKFKSNLKDTIIESILATGPRKVLQANAKLARQSDILLHPYVVHSSLLAQSAQRILDAYQRMHGFESGRSSEGEMTLSMWQKDRDEMEKLLTGGRKVVEHYLEKYGERKIAALTKGASDDQFAAAYFGKLTEQTGCKLDKSLEYAQRGVRKLLKGLPREEDA